MESDKRFTYLLTKYSNNTIIHNEQIEFMEMVDTNRYDDIINATIDRNLYNASGDETECMSSTNAQQILMAICKGEPAG